ncbi:hypothetical protein TRAPUB_5989 [Trametes pubescens]|uniref:Uncharacterized protein n=1 Tax=Trametes pubescens TaxID=154538 RepID=A0A1M2V754_TRAPU|nr:hypothetical protein TRAPUB_5989 [Trametes pubescens]
MLDVLILYTVNTVYGITLLAALHSRRTAREKGRSKIENDASDLVFGVGVLSQAAPPAVHIGPSPRSGHIHAQQARPSQLRPASGMTAYSDVIEIEAMSQSLPSRNLPVVHGDQGIEQMKADVEHDLA